MGVQSTMRIVALAGLVVVLAACSGGGGEVVTSGGTTQPSGDVTASVPPLDTTVPIWRLAPPTAPDPARVAALEAAFGGPVLLAGDAAQSWSFTPETPAAAPRGETEPRAVAMTIWEAIGVDPSLLTITASSDGGTIIGTPGLGDRPSPLPYVVTVNSAGQVVSASGHLAEPVPGGDQPRIGTAAALAQVTAPAGDDRGEQQPSLRPDPTPAVPPLSPEPTTRPTTANPVVVDVAEIYTLSPAADGGLWLLPAYTFTFDDGESRTVSAVAAPPEAAALIGQSEDDAAATAASRGWAFRVAERDGVEQLLTADYNPERVNVALRSGTVTRAWMG